MTVLDFVRLTRANLWLIFACMSLGLLGMFAFTYQQPVVYTATSSAWVVVPPGRSTSDELGRMNLASQKAANYITLINSLQLAERVVDDLGLSADPESLRANFSAVQQAQGSQIIMLSASAGTPADAQALANALGPALAAQVADVENAGATEGEPVSDLIQIQPQNDAYLPTAPSSPNYTRNLLIGAIAGIVLGYGIGLIRRSVDRRTHSVSDVEEAGGTSVIGIIPGVDHLQSVNRGVFSDLGQAAESFRQLRTNLRFVDVDKPPRSIVITSANAGEGKSTVSANLARVIAASGQPVILVDADLRRPTVADTYEVDGDIGLTQVLAGDVTLSEAIQDSKYANLRLISAGRIPPNPSELLGSQRMHAVVNELSKHYLVLLDAPPLLPVTDAGLLTVMADGALLVCVVNRTYREQVEQCRKVLDQVGGRLFGAVLNMAPLKGLGSVVYGYGYGNYKQEYYSRRQYNKPRRRVKARKTKAAARTAKAHA